MTFEHEYDEDDDSWGVNMYETMSVSRDGAWMVGLESWQGLDDEGRRLPARLGVWDMAKGDRRAECDTRGYEFNVIAPHVWSIVDHLVWPEEPMSLRTMGEYVEVEFIDGATEQLDCVVGGVRRLIHFIACSVDQIYYGVDLLERGFQVPVYAVDHDFGDGAHVAFDTLAGFAYALKRS